uniref:AAA+ ATPase domain-containing protein n=1 Tax=Lepidothamnus intermedius TaxID=224738 RepID=A0A3Q9WXN7_9CONI|nr:hypothetical protein [Lepidothamnus intermedius]
MLLIIRCARLFYFFFTFVFHKHSFSSPHLQYKQYKWSLWPMKLPTFVKLPTYTWSKVLRIQFLHRFRLEMMQLFNPWNRSYLTESYLFRFLTQIFSGRERFIKILHFRVIITLFLRDLRSFGVNQTIKVVILLTLPVFMYRANCFLNEKKHMMFVAPNFTKNLLMVPHLFVSLSKYDTSLLNNKNGGISENPGTKSWETSLKSEDSPISWNVFDIFSKTLSIYESYMRTVTTQKSFQSFNLLKNDHPFQDFMESERRRRVDFWKTRTYLFKYSSSNCVSSLDSDWNIFRKNQTELNPLNCIRFTNQSYPWNMSSSVCNQNKGQWKKIVLEITDQLIISMTKPHQVNEEQIALDIDNYPYQNMDSFSRLNENRLLNLNQIFNRRGSINNQFLLSLLNMIDEDNCFVNESIDNSKNRVKTLAQLIYFKYRIKVDGIFSKAKFYFALQKAFRFYLRYGRNFKEKTLSNWIKNERLNNVMQNAINKHSSTWRVGLKIGVYNSIIRMDKYANQHFIVYNWSTQTEYFQNGFKQFVYNSYFLHNYVKLKNIVFEPNEYRVLVPIDIHLPLKEFFKFFFSQNLLIDFCGKKLLIHFPNLLSNWWSKFRSKFNINYIVAHKSFIIDFLMGDEDQYDTPEQLLLKEKRLVLYDSVFDGLIELFTFLNNWFEPFRNKSRKLIESIVVQILDDSPRLKFLDEGTISQPVLNEIPINQSIGSLFDNQKNGLDCVDNTDFWARLNDRNWLNPLELSNQSSLRTSFDKANTIEFFDYLHHPRLNYKERLDPYMENLHIKKKNITYKQLFNLFPIHNNLFPLPIDDINPLFLKKETIYLIKSQVADILLAKYLRDRTFISDWYKSLNLLTRFNHFVHDKRVISSIGEISTTPFTREQQIVDFEKRSCPPFFNSLDSKETEVSQYKSDARKDIDLFKMQSYADDLRLVFETLCMKMSKIEIKKKFVKKSTKSSNNIISIKAKYYTLRWWECLKDILLDTYLEIKKSPLLTKDKEIMSRALRFKINYFKSEFYETYRLFFTSTWWKYLGDIYSYPLLEILINIRDQIASILDLFQYKNEFIIHILDIFNIMGALPAKLLAILKWKLKKFFQKFYNYVLSEFFYYFFIFSDYGSNYASHYGTKIYNDASSYFSQFFSKYGSHYISKIYNYFRSKKWRNWCFSVSSWVKSVKEEIGNQKKALEFAFKKFKKMKKRKRLKMMERFLKDVQNGLIKNEKSWVLSVFSLAVGYFLLPFFLFPVHLLNFAEDFFFWKDMDDFEEFYQELHTLQEPMPEIIYGWFVDYEDFRIPIKGIYEYFIRKWCYIRELKRKTYLFSIYKTVLEIPYSNIDQRERELAHFLIKEKSLSELELKLLTNPKDFSFKWTFPVTADPNMPIAGYLNDQPGLIYLRYLAEAYQEGIMNYTNKFDPLGLAERSVFLAFCNKITSSQKYRWDSLDSSRLKPFSLNLGLSSSYFSKRIFLIGPMETGRSFLVKSLAADSYVPLIRISLRYFLPQQNDCEFEFREREEDPMLYVHSIFDNTIENKLERKDTHISIFRRHLELKRIQQFILALELAKAMSPCVIWIPNIHELHFESVFLCTLVERLFKENFPGIVIASTHIPKKVDPIPIGYDGLDRSIHIRMLPFSQRQREFAILSRSKGLYLEKELACSDEFGFRTKGFDARDLAALSNEVFLISIHQKRSVIDTNTIRLAFNRTTRGFVGFDVQEPVRLPYKVGKAFMQHTLRNMDPLFAGQDFWTKRAFYLSHWYLEPSIARASIKQLTIFCHILGCLAGAAAQDSWFISERTKENWRPLDKFIKNDFAVASSLLESFLIEFSLGSLGICRSVSKFSPSIILTSAGQDIVTQHFNMMQQGISSFVNKKILKQENEFFLVTQDQDEEKFLNRIVWAPRTWRLSFLRSNQFDSIIRPNQFVELLQQYEDFSEIKSKEYKIDSPYGRCDKKYSAHKKWNPEMKAMLKERQIILGGESPDIDYQMQYQFSNQSIFYLERFLWNPTSFLFQEKRLNLFSRRELFINEEMLKRLYITYIPKRRGSIQNPFRHKRVLGVFSENKILNMKDWDLQDILPRDHLVSFQRIQAFGAEWRQISPHNPTFTYGRWLAEFSPMVDRFESFIDRQRVPNRCLSESFIYNFLSESYQYLINMFLSKRMLLDRMIKTLLKNKILFPDEIRDLLAEEIHRNKRD